MKMKRWMLATLLAGGVVLGYRAQGGCLNSKAPDEKLGDHFDEICEIARDNIDTPERGVRKLGRYLARHAGDMTGELVDTIALIERIDDDARHDERARVARDRIRQPLAACAQDWMRFLEAVDADPAATELVDRAIVRMNRTLEIIFSGQHFDVRHLPEQLTRALTGS
jgi:hypothetical protein